MIKKPEKKLESWDGEHFNFKNIGYNEGRKEMEAYYKQLIKENFIRRDKLLSVDEIAKIIAEHTDYSSDGMASILSKNTAKALMESTKR